MKVFIGITTYNRKKLIERTLKTLNIDKCEIFIIDDCSSEYDTEFLKQLLPKALVIRNKKNYGADYTTYLLFKRFLESDADILINLDSDLICRKDTINFVLKYMEEHKFFSLFNTDYHETIGNYDDVFVEKNVVGAAGCCFKKEIVEEIVNTVDKPKEYFDWKFSGIIKSYGVKILVCKNSMVQHMGWAGLNSYAKRFDYGKGFIVDSLECAQIIEDSIEEHENDVCNLNLTLGQSIIWQYFLRYRRFIKKIKNRE